VKVVIYHNAQCLCRACDERVMPIGDGSYIHRRSTSDGHLVPGIYRSGWEHGYRPGDGMVRVFETELPDGTTPEVAAGWMFGVCNLDPCELADVDAAQIARAYRARRLRSMSVGDVVVAGEVPLACASSGWEPVTGAFRETWTSEPGTVPVAHCAWCHVTGDDGTLETINPAGNQACRDARACQARLNAQQEAKAGR
jgi:hypothetical protein